MLNLIFINSTENLFQLNNLNYFNCFFSRIINLNGSGGIIYCSQIKSNISLINCIFYHCGANGHGGAIFAKYSNFVIIHSNCFRNCFGWRCPSYFIYDENPNLIRSSNINLTSEITNYILNCGSAAYSRELLYFSQNNISSMFTTEYGVLLCGSAKMIEIGNYFTFHNCTSPSFIAMYPSGFSQRNFFKNYNFINSYISSSIILFLHVISDLNISNCIFLNNVFTKMISGQTINSCSLTLKNCNFDFNYNSNIFIDCFIFDCNFFYVSTLIDFTILNTNYCWGTNIIQNTNLNNFNYFKNIFYQIFIFN